MKGIPEDILNRIEWKKEKADLERAAPTPKCITHDPKPCEDCGMTVTDRRLEIRYRQQPVGHWATKCANCNLYLNPKTGTYSYTRDEFIAVLREENLKKTK